MATLTISAVLKNDNGQMCRVEASVKNASTAGIVVDKINGLRSVYISAESNKRYICNYAVMCFEKRRFRKLYITSTTLESFFFNIDIEGVDKALVFVVTSDDEDTPFELEPQMFRCLKKDDYDEFRIRMGSPWFDNDDDFENWQTENISCCLIADSVVFSNNYETQLSSSTYSKVDVIDFPAFEVVTVE
jgi:hypothetical protein